jgi:hypothetical protein
MSNYEEITGNAAMTPDEKSDAISTAMVGLAVGAAIVPAHVNWAIFATILGGGVVAIGKGYGFTLSGIEGGKLIKQFFYAAGFTWLAIAFGSKLIAAVLETTGLGYVTGAAMDATISGAIAYAVGSCA